MTGISRYSNFVITRPQWHARFGVPTDQRPLPASEVWLHHSVTVAPDVVAPYVDDDAAIREIERITQERFKQGMAYTYLVTPIGRIYEGHPARQIGAHTGGHNTTAVGICAVGNYMETIPPSSMLNALGWLLRHLYNTGIITRPRFNGGHRDTKATDCPGDMLYRRIPAINTIALSGHYIIDPMEGPDDMADPKVLQVLEEINSGISSTYNSGFASRTPDGKPDDTHLAVSIAGVNKNLQTIIEQNKQIITLLSKSLTD